MSPSVSFILPVRNLQSGLRKRVLVVLEVLAELTDSFDLLIVDYGSRDDTRDVALDLVREYPQVDFLDQGVNSDLYAAIEAGIHRTRGEIIFVHDSSLPLAVSALQSLWQMRDDQDLVMAQSRSTEPGPEPLLDLTRGRRRQVTAATSIQMIRRRAMPLVDPPKSNASFAVDRVTRTDLLGESPEATRLPKLLARLRRFTTT